MILNQVVQKILGGKASLSPHQSPVNLQEQYFFIIFIFTSFGGHLCNSREYIYISMYRPLSSLDILSWLSPIKGEDLAIWTVFMSWVRFPRMLTLRQRLWGQPQRSESSRTELREELTCWAEAWARPRSCVAGKVLHSCHELRQAGWASVSCHWPSTSH